LESSPGDKGWEIFMLDYRVQDLAPLATVFTDEIMESYKKIFNFLWRLKRIEHQLSQSWRTNQEHVQKFERIRGMKNIFHRFNLCHHEMLHFVSTIHNYIMVEVLESAWKLYQDDLNNTVGDLDQLMEVQRRFVNSIMNKALLNENNNTLYRSLLKLLNQVFTFTYKKVQFFYPSALAEHAR
jgi:gamma-tubulin complex component 3